MLKANPKSKEAEICDVLDELGSTMYGKYLHNPTGKRPGYHIHPYSKQGTGVSCTIAYEDAATGEIVVLFAKKKNKDEYDQIGGYTRGVGPEGSEYLFTEEDEEQRDTFEEALLENINLLKISKVDVRDQPFQITRIFDRNQVQALMKQDFEKQQQSKLGKRINSIETKRYLAENKAHPSLLALDINDHATVLREVKEETGIDVADLINNKAARLVQLLTTDEFGITSEDNRIHNKATHYLLYLGKHKHAPEVKPGSDIGELDWKPITKIQLNSVNEDVILGDSKVRKSYALQILPRAIKKINELRIKENSHRLFSNNKNVMSLFSSLGHNLNPPPQNIYSQEAEQYRKTILQKSQEAEQLLKNFKTFNDTLNALKQVEPEKTTNTLLAEFKEFLQIKQQNAQRNTFKLA